MKKSAKRFLSMLLALSMMFGLLVFPAAAEEHDHTAAPEKTYDLNLDGFNFSPILLNTDDVEVDEDDPAIMAVEKELNGMMVLNAEGEMVPLTDDEKAQVLALYQQYLDNWAANANILGVQTPFFLSYNDDKDELGILGEMLVMAGIPVDAVRAGAMSFNDLTGMIQNFLYGDALGVQLYGQQVKAARDEILKLIESSGAVTDVQKYLVINDWLAHNVIFDMEYIMNANKEDDEKPMVAADPQPHEHYKTVYDVIYGDYEKQLTAQFEGQIRAGLEENFKQQYFNGAIDGFVYNLYLAQLTPSEPEATEPEATEAPTEPETTEAPTEPETTEAPTEPETTEAPTEPEATEAPTEPETTEAPTEPETTEAPTEPEPSVPEVTDENQTPLGSKTLNEGEAEPTIEEQARALTDKYMADNAEAIAADPIAFCRSEDPMMQAVIPVSDGNGGFVMGEDGQPIMMPVGEQIIAGWDAFWKDAQENGVEVDPVNAPGYKMTVDEIVEQQMNTPMADLPQKYDDKGNPVVDEEGNPVHMTPNEAVPVFAAQAAAGLTDGVLNYWQGSHFGALGRGSAVCLGYTKAFTYLVQCMKSDIYTKSGKIDDSADWKAKEELYYTDGALDVTKNYAVDSVRISFDASVTMYGQTEDNFNSDHFWNAVQVDGKWYYVDPCYTDVYTEVMMRDRVETDGSMNHMYFMFSHTTAADLYDGNYSDIKTLYGTGTGMGTDLEASASPANHTDYEDSWLSRIKSNTYFDGGYAYYMYDSTDLITMMEDYENDNLDVEAMDNGVYKIVRHKLTSTDAGNDGDEAFETLIEFNYKADEDQDESIARIYSPSKGKMIENVLLTKLYAQHVEDGGIYPSINITTALYNGKLYFNLSNVILSYELANGDVDIVKEYNTVYGLRDDTNPFGGMAFSVSDSSNYDFKVENHPIAGLTIKDDGKMYVSIATNFAFISGKDAHNSQDQSSYGYEFEESNYNPNYSNYATEENEDMYESFGYTKEINDNDEFMWSANFVETLSMSHFAGTSHTYETVSIEASCGRNAYTEERCKTCGFVKDDSRVEIEDTACEHHYIYFEETFYTKKNSDGTGGWNTGFCYVCTECGYSITEPVEPEENEMGDMMGAPSYEEQMEAYEKEKAIYDEAVATAGHDYAPVNVKWAEDYSTATFSELECCAVCAERKNILDVLLQDDTLHLTLEKAVTVETSVVDTIGTCPEGVVLVYGASGEVTVEIIEDKPETFAYTVSTEVKQAAAECKFEGGFCTVCGDCKVKRIYGDNRCETAYATADALKDVLGVDSFKAIIIANGDNFADALAGSYLANVKGAPILLYRSSFIDANLTYIKQNLASDGVVYILGGTAAVSEDMESALTDEGIKVERLYGDSRFVTNLKILEEAGVSGKEVLIATGWNFADSLSASATGLPILLVNSVSDKLTDEQIEFLKANKGSTFTIVGGTSAVSATLEAAIEEIIEKEVGRVYGDSREETSVKVAEKYFKDPDMLLLAYSRNFPDGLCGGPLAFALKAPLILTNVGKEAPATEYAEANEIEEGYILGGTAVVAEESAKSIFRITGPNEIPAL